MALFLAATVLAGCGGGNDDSKAQEQARQAIADKLTRAPDTIESPPSNPSVDQTKTTLTTTEANTQPATRTLHFELKNSDGWTYAGDLQIPDETVTLTKDISSSPPGQAKLEATVEGTPVEAQTFSVTNEGRPNGPEITVEPGYFAYGLADVYSDSNENEAPTSAGPCNLGGNDQIQNYEPFDTVWKCNAPKGTDEDTGTSTDDGDEEDTQDLIENFDRDEPTYVVNIGSGNRACNVFVYPDDSIKKAPDFEYGCSQKLKLSVSGS